jgi:hypothetical protein
VALRPYGGPRLWVIAECANTEQSLTLRAPLLCGLTHQRPTSAGQRCLSLRWYQRVGVPQHLTAANAVVSAVHYVTATELYHTTLRTRDMYSTIWERKQGRSMFRDVGETSTIWFGRPSDNQQLPSVGYCRTVAPATQLRCALPGGTADLGQQSKSGVRGSAARSVHSHPCLTECSLAHQQRRRQCPPVTP